MPRRPTFVERVAQTVQLAPVRSRAQKRLSRAAREALAPKPPAAALAQYQATMATYTKRVEALVEKHVLSKLPVVGSGDVLDPVAIERGLSDLEESLDRLADLSRRSSQAAANRAAQHARAETQRILNMSIPKRDPRVTLVAHDFAELGVARMKRAGKAQILQIRKNIAAYKEGESMRAEILRALWVSRQRAQVVARNVVFGVQTRLIASYAQAVGSDSYIWCTQRDERVRHGHAVLDGKTFRWDTPPFEGSGNHHPAGAANCRCRPLPVGQRQP